jgi:hypothetical protein
MASMLSEYEVEAMPELEDEGEGEYEDELEGEFEQEGIFGNLASLAGQALGGLLGESEAEDELEMESEYEDEGEIEGEIEGEEESELNPIRRAYPDALMEHLAHAAAEAESEAEAEAFLGALVPLAARAAPAIMRAAPQLIRGVSRIGRMFRRRRRTRPLVRTLPTIIRRTIRTLNRPGVVRRQGGQVPPRLAVQTLARQTRQMLRSPRVVTRVYRRSRALDRRFHRAAVVVNIGPVYARR